MHAHTILFFASLVLPILGTPVPANHINSRDNTAIERRNSFSIAQLYRDLLKRGPLIEALPEHTSYGVADGAKRSVSDDNEEVEEYDDMSATSSRSPDKRRVKVGGGGSNNRRVKVAPGGPSKRHVKVAPGGPGKRRVKVAPGGPSKRDIEASSGDAERRRVKNAGGGPGKRETEAKDGDAEKRRVKVGGGGPSQRRAKVAGGGPRN